MLLNLIIESMQWAHVCVAQMYTHKSYTVIFSRDMSHFELHCECVIRRFSSYKFIEMVHLSLHNDDTDVKTVFSLPSVTSHQWCASTFIQSLLVVVIKTHYLSCSNDTLNLTQVAVHGKWIIMVVNGVKPSFSIVQAVFDVNTFYCVTHRPDTDCLMRVLKSLVLFP